MNKIAKSLASGCFSGYCPVAPGTAGSAVIAILYWLLPISSQWTWTAAAGLLYFVGVTVSAQAERDWGKDGRRIVVDEMVGFLATVLFLPKTPLVIIFGFFVFRFLDIAKPFPAGRSQKLPGGWGIMTDDLVAGIYANFLLRLAIFLFAFWRG